MSFFSQVIWFLVRAVLFTLLSAVSRVGFEYVIDGLLLVDHQLMVWSIFMGLMLAFVTRVLEARAKHKNTDAGAKG